MLSVDELLVTQKKIRDQEQLMQMIHFVREGGFFTNNCLSKHKNRTHQSPLIEITLFEDGQYFIHDGHHRAASIIIGGRNFIDSTEYRIRKFTYDSYLHPNLEAGWWTPFDPKTEVRLPDMSEYKSIMRQLTNTEINAEIILEIIQKNRALYVEARGDVHTLRDFVGSLSSLLQ